MARYINADALVRAISLYANRTSLGQICPPDLSYSEMLDIIAEAPTADVVPKSEVERLQAEVDQLHALLECGVFANSVEDWQKFLNEKRA